MAIRWYQPIATANNSIIPEQVLLWIWAIFPIFDFSLLFSRWGRWKDILNHGRFKKQLTERDVESICRALLAYCLVHYRGDDKIKSFMWDLIAPTEDGRTKELQNHLGEGLLKLNLTDFVFIDWTKWELGNLILIFTYVSSFSRAVCPSPSGQEG